MSFFDFGHLCGVGRQLLLEIRQYLVETPKSRLAGSTIRSIGGNLAPLLHSVDLRHGQRSLLDLGSLNEVGLSVIH
jgi:hypothetical protein